MTPAQSTPQDRREALGRWLYDSFPEAVPGNWRETKGFWLAKADALLTSQALRDLVSDEVERIADDLAAVFKLYPFASELVWLAAIAAAIRSGERGLSDGHQR